MPKPPYLAVFFRPQEVDADYIRQPPFSVPKADGNESIASTMYI